MPQNGTLQFAGVSISQWREGHVSLAPVEPILQPQQRPPTKVAGKNHPPASSSLSSHGRADKFDPFFCL
ncbi:uncharacterized protein DS421_13g424550 [Arachis hypogaea]|nr:uncharacterized protein DS421_13g424550 [Arachis hypogaea]